MTKPVTSTATHQFTAEQLQRLLTGGSAIVTTLPSASLGDPKRPPFLGR